MQAQQVNRISGRVLVVLSLVALLTVLSGFLQPPQPPETDEGAAAHIFQLTIVASAATILVFLITADWTQRWRRARFLALPGTVLVLAFVALYYLEHFYFR